MTTQYTPGPWKAGDCAPGSIWKGDTQIASFDWTPEEGEADFRVPSRAERHANARIAAAAPEMYEALRELVNCEYRTSEMWAKAYVAIKKAEGRS